MILFHWNDHGDVNDTKAAKNEDLVLNMYANVFSGTGGSFSALTFFSVIMKAWHCLTNEPKY